MTNTYTIAEKNCTTGEETIREMTAEEIAAYEANIVAHETRIAELEAAREAQEALKESAKAKLVAGEPLTEEEASVLVI
jgi:hypothetical protein